MRNKLPYSTPSGYFENLESRLMDIPYSAGKRRSLPARVAPYLALAASISAAVIIGNTILNRTTVPQASEDEIIEYLIDSGITLAQLEEHM